MSSLQQLSSDMQPSLFGKIISNWGKVWNPLSPIFGYLAFSCLPISDWPVSKLTHAYTCVISRYIPVYCLCLWPDMWQLCIYHLTSWKKDELNFTVNKKYFDPLVLLMSVVTIYLYITCIILLSKGLKSSLAFSTYAC